MNPSKNANRTNTNLIAQSLTATCLAALLGCAPAQYITQQGIGQFIVIANSVPIDDVLNQATREQEELRKLQLIIEAREFARRQLGLDVGDSYALFHDTGGKPVAYNLSAAPKHALQPKQWVFPIIGLIDYIGFFDEADAIRLQSQLQNEGYDTYVYGVDAYSTLGWFPDPVQSPMLRRSDGSLVETVIHELTHNTVYVNGKSTFNESLATYVGRLGVRLFYQQPQHENPEYVAALNAAYEDRARINDWFAQFYEDLQAYYQSDLTTEEKIAGREAQYQAARDRFQNDIQPTLNFPENYDYWAQIPTNNAFLLLNRRYNYDLQVFQAVYDALDQDFSAFLDVVRIAAQQPDPFQYLRQHAGSR